MPFFSRPELSNEQFKQSLGSVLALSGQTQIATISGLTIMGDSGNIPIYVTGGTDFKVMTYLNDKIVLRDSTGGGSGIYSGASPTTCTIGGLVAGTNIYGSSISDILEEILVPTLYPALTDPSNLFTISPSTLLYEVGTDVDITGCAVFGRGKINPAYGTSGCRSGSAWLYEYLEWTVPTGITSSSSFNTAVFNTHSITYGNNTLSSRVWYCAGEQPKDSTGSNYCAPLASGCTAFIPITISGIYPYYYGKVDCGSIPSGTNRPAATACLITGGTKVISSSYGTICANFNSGNNDYIWFAIPNIGSTAKTKWYLTALNNGSIGGAVSAGGNLFPSPVSVTNVENIIWCGQTYNMYISNYQTTSGIMELRNI